LASARLLLRTACLLGFNVADGHIDEVLQLGFEVIGELLEFRDTVQGFSVDFHINSDENITKPA
jgi:hypothetical protein